MSLGGFWQRRHEKRHARSAEIRERVKAVLDAQLAGMKQPIKDSEDEPIRWTQHMYGAPVIYTPASIRNLIVMNIGDEEI
jgi:hypothetical protein